MKSTAFEKARVFLDTNVMLDYLLDRGDDGIVAERLFEASFEGKIALIVAAHSITNISYIIRKVLSHAQIKQAIKNFCGMCEVCEISETNIQKAIAADYTKDFEAALQIQCAVDSNADYILTRDEKGFENSPISVMYPGDFTVKNAL